MSLHATTWSEYMGFKVLKHNDYSEESISSCYQSTTQNVKTGAKKSAFSTWLARHYDLARAKIILGFWVQKLHNANWNAKKSGIFKNIEKKPKNIYILCCSFDMTHLDIEPIYTVEKWILCYNQYWGRCGEMFVKRFRHFYASR